MKRIWSSPARAVWTGVVVALAAVTAVSLLGGSETTWEQPELLFGLVIGAAAVCIFGATLLIVVADRRELAEIGLLGSALIAASALPLVHGLVTPGVLYGETAAFRLTAFLSLPTAVAVAAPLLVPRSRFGRWAARHWRDWTLLALLGVFVVAGVVTFLPDLVEAPAPGDAVTIAVSAGLVLALGSLSLRQLRFYELGGRVSNLVASFALAMLATTAVLPLEPTDYSVTFWWLHAAGSVGVFATCAALVFTEHMSTSAQDILAPILVRDPLVAFELGLSPVVHRFVADLERKDELTRDHVIRTGELAIRVGERMHLPTRELRDLGLAAMLHDVGKLSTPDEILTKPDRLTPAEYEVVKLHTVHGEEMLRDEPALAGAAPIVRSHHERVDGGGYPDGLVGDQIPRASRIIAVCDAIDAMTHDKQYREALPLKLAIAVLHEHAGSQWDPEVIRHVIAVVPTMPAVSGLDEVGRHVEPDTSPATIPDDVAAILEAVDAEI